MEYRIEPLRPEWIAAAAALEKQCFSLPWSEKSLQSELDNPRAALFAAVGSDGALLGWAGLQHVCGEGNVTNIAVSPAARRRGIGRALTQALIGAAEDLGLSSLTLEVRASNQAAVALYAGLGFDTLGIRPRFYERPTEDALMMRKTLR